MTTNTDSPRSDESLDTVRSIMKNVRTCMFVTTADDGSLHSAPMTTQEAEFELVRQELDVCVASCAQS